MVDTPFREHRNLHINMLGSLRQGDWQLTQNKKKTKKKKKVPGKF